MSQIAQQQNYNDRIPRCVCACACMYACVCACMHVRACGSVSAERSVTVSPFLLSHPPLFLSFIPLQPFFLSPSLTPSVIPEVCPPVPAGLPGLLCGVHRGHLSLHPDPPQPCPARQHLLTPLRGGQATEYAWVWSFHDGLILLSIN